MSGDRARRWMASLIAEHNRRQAAKLSAAGGDPRDWLIAKLDQMGERMRAAPGYQPPPPAEAAAISREVEAFLAKRG